MDKIVIKGGKRLEGEIDVSGAKNASLPILVSSILTEGENIFSNIPNLHDINTIMKLLQSLGASAKFIDNNKVAISTDNLSGYEAPYELVKTMRASVLVLGPLVSRFGKAKISLPGGCAIGTRPINLHLKGLQALGAEIKLEHGYVNVEAKRLKGAEIYFDIPTVTGTENLMMASVKAEGITVLKNAACEPEVVDLANVLNKMGAHIKGAGTNCIVIEGVSKLNPVTHKVIYDRIEAGTFMVASAITKGSLIINNCPIRYMGAIVDKFREVGVKIEEIGDNKVKVEGNSIKSSDIKTLPYPGFPTDMQAQFMALMTIAKGTSVITETIFENRFMHVSELQRMGADIKIEGNSAIVKGVSHLSGAPVMATDLRASASLILAGLIAEGVTEVHRVYHLDRGYEKIEEKLIKVGANIERRKA